MEEATEVRRPGAAVAPPPTHRSTVDRLRFFEDHLFGKDHLRPHGQVEKGVGSAHAALPAAHKAHHAALEHLIEAEKYHQVAHDAATAAHTKLQAAVKRAAETEKAL
jgi:hypothetical protein